MHSENNLNYTKVTCSASRYFFAHREFNSPTAILKQYFISVARLLPDIDEGDIHELVSFHHSRDAIFYISSGVLKSYSVYTNVRKEYKNGFNNLNALFLVNNYAYYANTTHVRRMNIDNVQEDIVILNVYPPITAISGSSKYLYIAHNESVTAYSLDGEGTIHHFPITDLPHSVNSIGLDLSTAKNQIYLAGGNKISTIREKNFIGLDKNYDLVYEEFQNISSLSVIGKFSDGFSLNFSWFMLITLNLYVIFFFLN